MVRRAGIEDHQYQSVRLLACYGGKQRKGRIEAGQRVATAFGKPVKAYQDKVALLASLNSKQALRDAERVISEADERRKYWLVKNTPVIRKFNFDLSDVNYKPITFLPRSA